MEKTMVQVIACSTQAQRKYTETLPRRQHAWRKLGVGTALCSFLLAGIPLSARAQAPDGKQTIQTLEKQVQQLAQELQKVQSELKATEQPVAAGAQAPNNKQTIQTLEKQVQQLAQELQETQSELKAITQSATKAPQQPEQRVAPFTRPGSVTPSVSSVAPFSNYSQTVGATQPTTAEQKGHGLFKKKPGRLNTFYTKNGEVTFFANLGVSFDDATKGMNPIWLGTTWLSPSNPNYVMWNPPIGNMGWVEDVTTPGSSFGVRGSESTWINNVNLLYQLQTGFLFAEAPGLHESGSQEQDTVNGTLFTSTSYIGLGKVGWGAVLIGKTQAPYLLSTKRLDAFGGMEGSIGVVMGNTGGDNRIEFGALLDHSVWYTSPNLRGFNFNVLFSPGQDRGNNSTALPEGEPRCNGGDNPGNGGLYPIACNDGSYSDVVSANIAYTKEPFYITAAYERHMKTNRQSDVTAIYPTPPTLWMNANGSIATNDPNFPADVATQYPNYTGTVTRDTADMNQSAIPAYFYYVPAEYFYSDVADEDAGKIAIQYSFFHKKTVIGAIGENFHRYVPNYLQWQNERQRKGVYVAGTQALGKNSSISLGWAEAFRAPGDPCQHNNCINPAPYSVMANGDLTAGRGVHNEANTFSAAFRRAVGPGLIAYMDWGGTYNSSNAHYDLGAGGHGVTTDCHDNYDTTGAATSVDVIPHEYTGCKEKAVSVGLQKRF